MTKDKACTNLNIEVSEDEYERLIDLKDAHGLTWRGLIIQGMKALDTEGRL